MPGDFPPLPELLQRTLNCACEVRSMRNVLLLVGVVESAESDSVMLRDANENPLPLLMYQTPVKLSVLQDDGEFMVYMGLVFISTADRLEIMQLTTLQQYERRNFFRVTTEVPVTLFAEIGDGDGMMRFDAFGEPAAQGIMRDISLGGCLLELPERLPIGKAYYARFQLLHVTHDLRLVIGRETENSTEEALLYGCMFERNRDPIIDAVCRDLFALQRLSLKRYNLNNL